MFAFWAESLHGILDSLLGGTSDSDSIGTTQKIVKGLPHSGQSSDAKFILL